MSYFRNPDTEPLTKKESETIELIRELLKDESIREIEAPWKSLDDDNTYIIRTGENSEMINTSNLNEYFKIIQVTVSSDWEISIFVEPKQENEAIN